MFFKKGGSNNIFLIPEILCRKMEQNIEVSNKSNYFYIKTVDPTRRNMEAAFILTTLLSR